ncbi:MAG TPA: glycoside hydrolase family 140 protein [Polyangiales bacterium]|nr:glycoside hydrolase family 140 protein [Polyangiales bacterium]
MIAALLQSSPALAAPPLRVTDDHHSLVRADGAPLFWLGDTAWLLFHRLDRAQTERYLRDRAQKGFTVIQAVALGDLEGPNMRSAAGETALRERDPARPNEAFFQHVDWVIQRANELGLTLALLPCWGDTWNPAAGEPRAIFDPPKARAFGKFLGRRYMGADLVWVLGGDHKIDSDAHKQILRAMAEGLREGDGGAHLITFHPPGSSGSSTWLHDEPWLDFNMRQNGHSAEYDPYAKTRDDWARTPPKPVLDGEPLYEDHPLAFLQNANGHSVASDVRRALYWDLFNGAFGHTYGNHAVWQFWTPELPPANDPLLPWTQAIAQPGASQMSFARKLLESRPGQRVPDDGVLVTDRVETSVPGRGRYRFVAMRDDARRWAMVYAPVGRSFSVHLDAVKAHSVKASWYDPRTGLVRVLGIYPAKGEKQFTPPNPGEQLDWILVLDDVSADFPKPGGRR